MLQGNKKELHYVNQQSFVSWCIVFFPPSLDIFAIVIIAEIVFVL